jgi:predicted nucleic acid-binding protein
MRTLLDTNILLRTSQPASPQHADAIAATTSLIAAGRTFCISSQSIYEFLAVATKPQTENGLGMTHSVADAHLTKLLISTEVLYDSPAIANELRRLVVAHHVTGKNVHDARIVAAMNAQSVTEILTFNEKDFTRYAAITVLSPSSVAQGKLPGAPPTSTT